MSIKKRIFRRWRILIPLLAIIVYYSYQTARPTIVFHTYNESGYLGKVSKINGSIDKLYVNNHTVSYRLPFRWEWNEDDEIGIFTLNYDDLLQKQDIDFWRLDIYLDEEGAYKEHSIKKYFWEK